MKKLIIVFSLMANVCFASVKHSVWVMEKNERGNYDCQAPNKHKQSEDYSYWAKGWRKCEIVAQNDEADQMLEDSVGKVVTVRGSYIEDEISISRKVQRAVRFFTREVMK